MVKKAGKLVGIHLRPHDLRHFCATYAARDGTPIGILSKTLLRCATFRLLKDAWERQVILRLGNKLSAFTAKILPGLTCPGQYII